MNEEDEAYEAYEEVHCTHIVMIAIGNGDYEEHCQCTSLNEAKQSIRDDVKEHGGSYYRIY